jgi:hypothetical protein
MTKKAVINSFNQGVNSDISEENFSTQSLISGHNIKITSNDDKQFILQKEEGRIEEIDAFPSGVVPLAVKEFNDVAYLVNYNKNTNKVEYGMYPSVYPGGSLITEIDGATMPVINTELLDVRISEVTEIPESPDSHFSFKITNHSDLTVTIKINSNLAFRDGTVNSNDYTAYVNLASGSYKTYYLRPGLGTQIQEDPRGFGGIETDTPKLQVSVTNVLGNYRFIRYVADEVDLVNNFAPDDFYYVNIADYAVSGMFEEENDIEFRGSEVTRNIWSGVDLTAIDGMVFRAFNDNGHQIGVKTIEGGWSSGDNDNYTISLGSSVDSFKIDLNTDTNSLLIYDFPEGVRYIQVENINNQFPEDVYSYISLSTTATTPLGIYDGLNRQLVTLDFDTVSTLYRLTENRYIDLSAVLGNNSKIRFSVEDSISVYREDPADESNFSLFRDSEVSDTRYIKVICLLDGSDAVSFTALRLRELQDEYPIIYEYNPFINFYDGDTSSGDLTTQNYSDFFATDKIEYNSESVVDLEVQSSYDGSVNLISASKGTAPRIVNSRTQIDVVEGSGTLIMRNGNNLDNVYSDDTIEKTRLIPYLGETVVDLSFEGVIPNSGNLAAGGYKYYFKLMTGDGTESEIVEQSRLVSVHIGEKFGNSHSALDGRNTGKSVRFKISNIDNKSFRFLSVYYTITTGETDTPSVTGYKINRKYEINTDTAECFVEHTGDEDVDQIDVTELQVEYTPIVSAEAVNQQNSRLLLGNTVVKNIYSDTLKKAALSCYPSSGSNIINVVSQRLELPGFFTVENTYASPDNIYYKLGYLPGETYELAINYVFDTGNVSPSYPIQGFDFTRDGEVLDSSYLSKDFGWLPSGQNSKGVIRTEDKTIGDAVPSTYKLNCYTIGINTQSMVDNFTDDLKDLGVVGYFISRRKRKPDMLMEGLISLTATAPKSPSSNIESNVFTSGEYLGVGCDPERVGSRYVIFPTPGNVMNFSTEDIIWSNQPFDALLYAPVPFQERNKYLSFLSPDIMMDGARFASRFVSSNSYGLHVTKDYLGQHIAYDTGYILKQPAANPGERYGRIAYPSGIIQAPEGDVYLSSPTITFVGDSYRSLSDRSFTSRIDRQLALMAPFKLGGNSPKVGGTNPIVYTLNGAKSSFFGFLGTVKSDVDYSKRTHFYYDDAIELSTGYELDTEDLANQNERILLSNVAYSPYLGIEVGSASSINQIVDNLNPPTVEEGGLPRVNYVFNNPDITTGALADYSQLPVSNTTVLGVIGRIYSSSNGKKLSNEAWESRYSSERSDGYFAISQRYKIDEPLDDKSMTGGDAYVGYFYHRLFRPGGVEGAPTASNPQDYKNDDGSGREGTGLTNAGYGVCFPVRSSYNFALRALDKVSDEEYAIHRSERTYLSDKNRDKIRGNMQAETLTSNYGNYIENSIVKKSQYNNSIPFNQVNQPNRVYISSADITSEFENGYRDFRGFNFRDYENKLGPLTKIESNGILTYLIFISGVAVIEVSERAAIQSEQGNNVYMANAAVLPDKANTVLSFIGSKYLKSVVSTNYGIYGVDTDKKKIWQILGSQPKIISDSRVQSIINPWFTDELTNIYSSHNSITDEVKFVFEYSDNSYNTIWYNSKLDTWYGTSDFSPIYQFAVANKHYNVEKVGTDTFKFLNTDNSLKTLSFYEDAYHKFNASFEFVIRDESGLRFMLDNLVVNGECVPDSIDIVPQSYAPYSVDKMNVTGFSGIPCHTNSYVADTTSITVVDDYTISANFVREFKVGDLITLKVDDVLKQFIVSKVTMAGSTSTIVLNKEVGATSSVTESYFGWRIPLRLSLMEYYEDTLKVSIPTKQFAELLSGVTIDKNTSRTNQDNARPSGRWIKVKFNFEGIDPVYINSIISSINFTYS